ncbi:amidohydrolase [Pseudohalocynthiibacter aestuariivivens]|jgi:aminobenzoyl-glutamate utilization protein B|uniref:Amidohydrolase n=1 Tax=Pseudohalocynthiibacter aestuariivivens TaxID=1591409 RepID=A0ABV5JFE6_9RHOB|nr:MULTISPECIES: amidohydrolase [Pseudohalocynthiibacter]MBS9717886.1 amidohydrolase [Pseudohalocynthiibacter aestuariivivens]MCK0102964.1 amidohydrolase [Pseudohalocynthiibacter sp. F2068]
MALSMAQNFATRWVAEHASDLSGWTAKIFDFAETAWREYQSADWYVEKLRAEGFSVEAGSGGMPTAFCAEWQNGDGPVIGMYAEYDAVPGNCQAAKPERAPRTGLGFAAGGHTDPHSALGMSGLGGLLATKAAMEHHGIKGGLRFTGEPAEKVRGSKPIHAARGYYDGLAAMLSFHPFYMLPMCNTVRWDTHCGAAYSMIYRFICDEPERWGMGDGAPIPQSHSDVRAPGANDALVAMYSNSRFLRDSMLPHQGGWSISEAILSTGQATADNLPALMADIQYMMRVPTVAMAEQVTAALDRNAEAAAAMTGCRVERHWVCKSRPGLANHAMASLVWEAIQAVGAPKWDDAGLDAARAVQSACGFEPMEAPLIEACHQLIDPQEAERILRQDLAPKQKNSTSDDYTDITWHTPTARFYIARPALKAPAGAAYPSWAMNALGGISVTIDPMVQAASKTLAVSALRLLEDKSARDTAWEEFETRTGGGVGGENWSPPLCDYEPPIHFHWPEYVTTARGRDWCIPSAGGPV